MIHNIYYTTNDLIFFTLGFPSGSAGKEPACQSRRLKRLEFDPWVRLNPLEKEMATWSSFLAWKIPWTEEPGSPWGCEEADTTECTCTHFIDYAPFEFSLKYWLCPRWCTIYHCSLFILHIIFVSAFLLPFPFSLSLLVTASFLYPCFCFVTVIRCFFFIF